MTIDLVVRNMNNQSKLFKEGYKPWWRRDGELWRRLPESNETCFSFEWGGEPAEGGTGLSIRWRSRLENGAGTTFFAFCAPFGYEDCQRLLDTLESRVYEASVACFTGMQVNPSWPLRCISAELQEEWSPRVGHGIYFHRQQLGKSLDGRTIELLTITSSARQAWDAVEVVEVVETPPPPEDLGDSPRSQVEEDPPKAATGEDTLPSDLPDVGENAPHHFVGRPLIFLSARVHPGETPGQFAFLGLLRFLLSADPRAKELRDRFVFKLVPMLNPDGVARGHHRTNSLGLDLNRCYTSPTREEHEGVWLTKRILSHWSAQKRLLFCIDFHGHPSRRGCFLLGNKNSGIRQTWNIAFARLCQLNSPHFDIDSCDFEDRAADGGDEPGPGKHGTARAAIHRDCQVCHAYTFECNFHSGRSTKPMSSILHPREECPGGAVKTQGPMIYDQSCWAQAGESIIVSLLDVYGHNCYSRLPSSRYGSLARLLSLSPSFNSHRGQYGPPDNMPEVLGSTYSSVFEQQLPCRRSCCCWQPHKPGGDANSSAHGTLASPVASSSSTPGKPGHSPVVHHHVVSLAVPLPLQFQSPVQRGRADMAPSLTPLVSSLGSSLPVPLALRSVAAASGRTGKASSSGGSYKSSAPGGSRRYRRAAPASAGQTGAGKTRSGSKASSHRRATRTASAGALIVANGMHHNRLSVSTPLPNVLSVSAPLPNLLSVSSPLPNVTSAWSSQR